MKNLNKNLFEGEEIQVNVSLDYLFEMVTKNIITANHPAPEVAANHLVATFRRSGNLGSLLALAHNCEPSIPAFLEGDRVVPKKGKENSMPRIYADGDYHRIESGQINQVSIVDNTVLVVGYLSLSGEQKKASGWVASSHVELSDQD